MMIPDGFPKLPPDFEYDSEVAESLDHEHTLFFNIFRRKVSTGKKSLLVVHGQSEHGGRYQHFPHYLHSEYDTFLAVDLRGHGRSEGIRGHVDRFDEYVDDVLQAYELLSQKIAPNVSIDLFAHSMGGLVALRTLRARPHLPLGRLIISAPLLGLKFEVGKVKELAAKIISTVWGSLTLKSDLDPVYICHDDRVVKAYKQDRLVHRKATPGFYFEMKAAVAELFQEVKTGEFNFRSDLPVLFQLAAEDEIVSTAESERFFKLLKTKNKKCIIYPGLYHEIYNEPSKEDVFSDFLKWNHA